jgi:hypothetical protein
MNRTELAKSGKYYTYGHYLDGNLIYIGEGKCHRAWSMTEKTYYYRRKDVEVRIFGIFDNKELAVFNEGLLIYQERMDGNEHLLNKAEFGSGRRGCQHSNETRKKLSDALIGKYVGEKHPMFGRTGEKHPNFEGLTIGSNKDDQTIVFCGKKDMKLRGFNQGNISQVINGKAPHHQGFVFTRTSDPDQLRTILDTADFIDEISRKQIEEFIQE